MKEHLTREEHQKENCVYCGRSLSEKEWLPLHVSEALYRISQCDCGRKVVIRMPFLGSGHDSWNHSVVLEAESKTKHRKDRTRLRTLESRVKILSST